MSTRTPSMPTANSGRVLAIDPGFERLGIAVLEKQAGKEVLLYSACFKTPAGDPFPKRLRAVGEKLSEVISEYSPSILAIETLFASNNKTTVMHVAETRGVILYEAERGGLSIEEYHPPQIKVAVTGYGKASKEAVMSMVRKLIRIESSTTSDDELDAIAIGLTAFAHLKIKG